VIAFAVQLAQLGLEGLAHGAHDLLTARQHVGNALVRWWLSAAA
jgi:hypothetical protein